jgi:DNA-directed RNA polymerase subunit RPC12/RpoP
MKYEIRCGSCGGSFTLEGIEAGSILNCPYCQSRIRLQHQPTSPVQERTDTNPEEEIWPELVHPDEISKPSDSTVVVAYSAEKSSETEESGFLEESKYDPEAEFRRDLVRFIVPCRTLGEAATLLIMAILFAVWPFLNMFSFFCCLNWLIQVAMLGCFCTFFAEIITETARGGDQLPYFGSISAALDNFWSEIVVPTSNFVLAVVYCQIPAILIRAIFMIISKPGYSTDTSSGRLVDPNAITVQIQNAANSFDIFSQGILTAAIIIGIFFSPMVFLILSFDRIQLLFRPDLIWEAIRRILKPYLLGWISILIGGGIYWLTSSLLPEQDFQEYARGNYVHIAMVAVLFTVDLLVFIYAMRVVGLLYRHYEHLLPWRLEPEKKHPLEE